MFQHPRCAARGLGAERQPPNVSCRQSATSGAARRCGADLLRRRAAAWALPKRRSRSPPETTARSWPSGLKSIVGIRILERQLPGRGSPGSFRCRCPTIARWASPRGRCSAIQRSRAACRPGSRTRHGSGVCATWKLTLPKFLAGRHIHDLKELREGSACRRCVSRRDRMPQQPRAIGAPQDPRCSPRSREAGAASGPIHRWTCPKS